MRPITLVVCLLLLVAGTVVAEHHEAEGSAYTATLAGNYEYVSGQLVKLAVAMPEEVYSWRPAEGVRSTSETLVHVANATLMMPVVLGVAPAEGFAMQPDMMAWGQGREQGITAKADVIAELKRAIEYGKSAIADFPADQLDEQVEIFGMTMAKRDVLLILLSHSHEHLGQLIAYGRSNGVVPPWSQPQPE
jgi:uncharacterized damage-inducible protein DinB